MVGSKQVWAAIAGVAFISMTTTAWTESPEQVEAPALQLQEAAPAPNPMEEMMQLRQQLEGLSTRLQAIQAEAMEALVVVQALEAYEQRLANKMTELSPESTGQLAEMEEIVGELRGVTDPEALSAEEMQTLEAKYMRYQELAQQLQPVEAQAQVDKDVAEAREDLETKMLVAMADVDPETEQLIGQLESMSQRFQQLQQEQMMQQMQQQQQQAPQQQELTPFE